MLNLLQALPAFGWDTAPVSSEEIIDEGYLSVFCDIVYGGGLGWMDRADRMGTGMGGGGEREGSWALVRHSSNVGCRLALTSYVVARSSSEVSPEANNLPLDHSHLWTTRTAILVPALP
jgi:hypothetical protein